MNIERYIDLRNYVVSKSGYNPKFFNVVVKNNECRYNYWWGDATDGVNLHRMMIEWCKKNGVKKLGIKHGKDHAVYVKLYFKKDTIDNFSDSPKWIYLIS